MLSIYFNRANEIILFKYCRHRVDIPATSISMPKYRYLWAKVTLKLHTFKLDWDVYCSDNKRPINTNFTEMIFDQRGKFTYYEEVHNINGSK